MTSTPRIGTTHLATFTVEPSQTIALAGLPPILATPWLVWFVEHAALELLVPYLAEGEISVGTRLELEHLAPAALGAVVECQARLIHVDGADVTFQVAASDGTETLTRGLHRRKVVEAKRLARRIARKSSSGGDPS